MNSKASSPQSLCSDMRSEQQSLESTELMFWRAQKTNENSNLTVIRSEMMKRKKIRQRRDEGQRGDGVDDTDAVWVRGNMSSEKGWLLRP